MKIVLVQPEIQIKYGTYGYQAGLAALAAALKMAGFHDVSYVHVTDPWRPQSFREQLARQNPQVVGFYVTYDQHRFARRLLDEIPSGAFTVFGGPHPTIWPQCLDETPKLDAVCVGEGDRVIVEIVRALEAGKRPTGIAGLHVRHGDTIERPAPAPFIDDLDALPFEDREPFAAAEGRAGFLEISHRNSFRLGRGCPFQCSFCSNQAQSQAQTGTYVRFRGLDHLFGELGEVVRRYRPRVLFFQDDTFMSSRKHVERFCERYRREIGLPFEFFGRIDLVTEPLLQTLREAGGRRVSYGIESGDEAIRREILIKNFTNEEALEAVRLTKKVGMVAEAFVMTGFPGETPATLRKTADLLAQMQPDLYTLSTYFPNPGTALYARAEREGLLRYPGQVPDHVHNQRDLMLRLPAYSFRRFARDRRRFAWWVYGKKAPTKALLFAVYETKWGHKLLRWLSPLRQQIRGYAVARSATRRNMPPHPNWQATHSSGPPHTAPPK